MNFIYGIGRFEYPDNSYDEKNLDETDFPEQDEPVDEYYNELDRLLNSKEWKIKQL